LAKGLTDSENPILSQTISDAFSQLIKDSSRPHCKSILTFNDQIAGWPILN
jgi:hypothetical protein